MITVRVVPLADRHGVDWGKAWAEGLDQDTTVRELIAESLPLTGTKAPRYGVEVALWDMDSRLRVWAARTNPYKRKQLKKGAADFVQMVMNALRQSRLM